MHLTRRQFLKFSSGGILSLAALPRNTDSALIQFAQETFDLLLVRPPRIFVMGVGGAGGAVVDRLMKRRLPDVVYICVCTDPTALDYYHADFKLLIGQRITRKFFCGPPPAFGRQAAGESRNELREILVGADLVLVVGGMGGGTATGAVPVVAQLAREAGALTVSVVTRPFGLEGRRRSRQAAAGISELERQGATTVIVPMDSIREVVGADTTLRQAYERSDDAIGEVARAIINSIMVPGLINVTFSDVSAVLADRGPGGMAMGVGCGRNRAVQAAQAALRCPLLGNANIARASGVLVNIAADDLKLWEIHDFMEVIYRSLNDDALVCFGNTPNSNLQDEIHVTLIAVGIGPTAPA